MNSETKDQEHSINQMQMTQPSDEPEEKQTASEMERVKAIVKLAVPTTLQCTLSIAQEFINLAFLGQLND